MSLKIIQTRSLKNKITLLILAILVVVIWSLSFYASRQLYKGMTKLSSDQQFTTASFAATSINDEVEERFKALNNVAASITPVLMSGRSNLQKLLEDRPLFSNLFNGGVVIYGPDGTVIAETPLSAGRIGTNYMDIDTVAAALKEGKSNVGRPVMGRKLQAPVIGMTVPIRDEQGNVIGGMTGVTNLGTPNFLDKITSNRYGKTGGYILVAPKYRLIITDTDKKRIMEPLPPQGFSKTVDRFIDGIEGSEIFVNPVGEEVLASIKRIPAAGWYVAVRLPTAEAFEPIRSMQQRILLSAILLTVLAGIMTRWILQRQLSPMLDAAKLLSGMADPGQPLKPLPISRMDETGELISGFNRLLGILEEREKALKESESLWRFAVEGSGDGVWDWNIQTDEAKYSRRWKEMLGYSDHEILPKNQEWLERIHPDDRSKVAQTMQDYLDGRTDIYLVEYRLKCKDGGYLWIMSRGMVVSHSADGRPLRMVGTHTDMTRLRKLEHERGETLALLQKVSSQLPGFVYQFILNPDGSSCIPFASEGIRQIFRVAPEDVINDVAAVFSKVHPEDYEALMSSIHESAETLQPWRHEFRVKFDDGSIEWRLGNSVPNKLPNGGVLWHGFITDFTERKQVEQELFEQKNLVSTIIDSTSEAIFAKDCEGRYCSINEAGAKMIGYKVSDIIGKTDFDFLPPEAALDFRKTDELVMSSAHSCELEGSIVLNGKPCTFLTHKTPWLDNFGNIIGVIGISNNITTRKEHEKELLKIEKLESLGVLAGGIAHDFNNILTGIMGNISFAQMFLESEHKSYKPLLDAEKASVRAAELAHQLLTFARGGEPIKKVISIQNILKESISLALHGSNVKANINIPDLIHAIQADEGQMSQVFHNIIINATQAMPGGGTLTVNAANEILQESNSMVLPGGNYVRLEFIDQGCGISQDNLKRIFDPYFTTKSAGNGLGLASAHSIISRHGGHLGVVSIIGQGSTFTIHLPSIGVQYSSFKDSRDAEQSSVHKGGSILVMDDEEMLLEMMTGMLENLGYQAVTAVNGHEAISLYKAAAANSAPFAAVVMDLTIPGGMGGKDTAQQILSFDPHACLIVSSGYSNDPIVSEFGSYGFKGAISKPYRIKELGQLLSTLLEDRG